ncbi:MAG TPA: hypothetical protein VFQ37_12675 [Mycobacterium sp.]|nr:hypothetical protein [Mycobacterium sp.]
MAGEWHSPDLAEVLTVFATSVGDLVPNALQRVRPVVLLRQPRSQENRSAQERRNVRAHYDLSNDLFAVFLDETHNQVLQCN